MYYFNPLSKFGQDVKFCHMVRSNGQKYSVIRFLFIPPSIITIVIIKNTWYHLLNDFIAGVLQRFGIAYLITGLVMVATLPREIQPQETLR